jgi:hypothetical protein
MDCTRYGHFGGLLVDSFWCRPLRHCGRYASVSAAFILYTPSFQYISTDHVNSHRTLIADYVHTTVLYAIILAFAFVIYATSPKIGSPRAMYELLQQAAEKAPVDGNAGGSYLTMKSRQG